MKERPILFNAPMVRALLDGSKTQTRRAFNDRAVTLMRAAASAGEVSWFMDEGRLAKNDLPYILEFCPFGQVGDQLYVRESARVMAVRGGSREIDIEYQADGQTATVEYPSRLAPAPLGKLLANGTYREASRIQLEITGVRVERLQDISERDAWAEGCEGFDDDVTGGQSGYGEYAELWESINGHGSWEANPWVWVIEFKRES